MALVVSFTGRVPLTAPGAGSWLQVWSYTVQAGPAELLPGQRVALALPADADVRDPALFPGVPALTGMFLETGDGAGRQYVGRAVSGTGAQTISFVAPQAQRSRELLLVTQSQPGRPWSVKPFATSPSGPSDNVGVLPAPAPAPGPGPGRPVGDFAGTVPYASELFGVYQPLPGWLGHASTARAAAALGVRLPQEAPDGPGRHTLGEGALAPLAPLAVWGNRPPTDGILSPVGLVNLFREYFFEFDTFLGPPVGHLWLSPGGTVEVVETSTRRTLVERTAEQSETSTRKTEEALTEQTDLADAVKESNANETSLGVTSNASANYVGIVHADVSASYSTKNTTNTSSEVSHKHSRTQSSKASSEITRNFKTTFKTVTETTDTSSRRYVVQNTTDKLVNYELRRKMRKVGVQLQHIGTQLSWQVFVADPGRALGLGELVHVVPAPDLTALKQPVKPPPLAQAHVTYSDNYPIQKTADSDNAPHQDADWVKQDGWDRLWRGEEDEYIVAHFEYSAPPPGPGWKLSTAPGNEIRKVSATTSSGQVAKFLATYEVLDATSGRFRANCTNVHFGGGPYIAFTLALVWEPPPPEQDPAQRQYLAELAVYEHEVAKVQRAAYAQAVHDRLDLIAKVRPRDSEDLRKEERHSVFADLIGQLDLFQGQDEKRHLSAELIRGMFDVDQMLYFVEPDYWRPTPTTGTPDAGWPGSDAVGRYPVPPHDWEATSGDPVAGATVTSRFSHTGAVNPPRATTSTPADQLEHRVDYLITENTPPAPTGSSLGWLIQADGDERRNEFLNASWVKAVLPVRPGHELDALGWLSSAHVEGDAALDKEYAWQTGDPADWQGKSIGWVLQALAAELQARNTDITRTLAAERVFETGFDPLDGGFRPADPYQIFDQWTEVLPTDQVVAVEVTYDPRTGRQL
ncbi:hypothetical protein PV682_17440 [Streptomyces niveiscabiei]|uniref:hypothetical protein n=1 Tax=Streptomyces niveiscabiei TaxID=164115 RepID=UPI0029A2B6F3|nr:hypothetical protein [Streptomyces niveiscabiei]MDX3383236.1 hypothetical protein [Streptomyces niveiscabiei]